VDPVHNLFFVEGRLATSAEDRRPSSSFGPQRGNLRGQEGVVFFERTAQGDFKALGVLNTGAGRATGRIIPLPSREEIMVVGSLGDDESGPRGLGSVSIWSIHDRGDAPPRQRWLIQAPEGMGNPGGDATLDHKRKTLIVGGRNAMFTYAFPEIF
jgi:hypothetical protein